MKRGVNIVGYDPLWQDARKGRFKPRHFRIIKEGGFDTVRINLYGFRHMNEKLELVFEWFAILDGLVDEAVKQGLHVILDEHDYERCHEDTAAAAGWCWRSGRRSPSTTRTRPVNVVFEILNEPNRAMNDAWNDLHGRGARRHPQVQSHAQRRHWSGVLEQHFSPAPARLPKEDRHIIVTVHYYEPHEFTHQGASWAPEYTELSGIHWGKPEDYAKIEENFDLAQAWAKQNDRPILLGEFGAYDKAPQEDRIKYTAAVARAAEKRGWAWTYWQFDSNFIVYDIDKDAWNEPIYRALVPPAP